MSDDVVTLRVFNTHIEADLARSALEAAGIESMIAADDSGGMRPHMALTAGVRLQVRPPCPAGAGHAGAVAPVPMKPDTTSGPVRRSLAMYVASAFRRTGSVRLKPDATCLPKSNALYGCEAMNSR